MKKIITQGLFIGVVNLIVALLMSKISDFILPSIAKEYQNSAMFRPWNDPLMMIFFFYPFIVGIALAYFWSIFGVYIPGKTQREKAVQFIILYFLIATIPGMFITYTTFKVSLPMIVTWTLEGLIETSIAGWILAKK